MRPAPLALAAVLLLASPFALAAQSEDALRTGFEREAIVSASAGTRRVTAEFVEGVLVRCTIASE